MAASALNSSAVSGPSSIVRRSSRSSGSVYENAGPRSCSRWDKWDEATAALSSSAMRSGPAADVSAVRPPAFRLCVGNSSDGHLRLQGFLKSFHVRDVPALLIDQRGRNRGIEIGRNDVAGDFVTARVKLRPLQVQAALGPAGSQNQRLSRKTRRLPSRTRLPTYAVVVP